MFVSFRGTQDRPEAWASKLPRNHFVTSMLDMRAIQRSEKRLIAVPEIESNQSGFQITGALSCEDHAEKIVEVFCVDHSKPCCTLCATLSHKKCENVIPIQKAARDIKQSIQTTELIERLKEKVISKLKQRTAEHLNKIEKQMKFEMSSSKKQADLKLADEIDKFSNYKSMVNNWERLLFGTIRRDSDQHCLLEVNKIGLKLSALEEEMNDAVKSLTNISFCFVPSDQITKFTTIQSR
ncbi:unnamed protein product [Mytilus edulis]|uniref:B box-type domain-containing protein n=1 Tax=Mytilus edulis TaxID=6550 RepID=A0A8S3QRZ6_MYTED|nr:unnamed protein product [Mytilus edulis]